MKTVESLFFVLLWASSTLAAEKPPIEQIVDNIKSVCLSPSDSGKLWEVKVEGEGRAKVKFIADLKGDVEFTKGEWEGVQRVLKEKQADENARYRDCVERLTPMFLDKFVLSPTDPCVSLPIDERPISCLGEKK